jgi:lipopolysaccharide/colanic/teichoic acid biosynthesis glycosyltransferase
MSLVGPREIARGSPVWGRGTPALAVKPGLTGPMQVAGRGDLDMPERLRLEIDYIQNYSLGKDLDILLRSIRAILTGRGAY